MTPAKMFVTIFPPFSHNFPMILSVFVPVFPESSRLALPVLFACRLAIFQVDLARAHGAADGLFAGISQGISALALVPFRFTHLSWPMAVAL